MSAFDLRNISYLIDEADHAYLDEVIEAEDLVEEMWGKDMIEELDRRTKVWR